MEEHPFPDLKIASSEFLNHIYGRSKCPKCKKLRKYYCYTCYVPVGEIEDLVPKVKLPVKVDIIKHPAECDGKSTAVHAGVICPDDVTIYTYPCIPDYDDPSKVVLVFPGENSVSLEELARHYNIKPVDGTDSNTNHETVSDDEHTDNADIPDRLKQKRGLTDVDDKSGDVTESHTPVKKLKLDADHVTGSENYGKSDSKLAEVPGNLKGLQTGPIDRVVFVDSTWNQTRTICGDERLRGIRCVEIKSRKTQFWRHQADIPDTYLSTIEAVYYFLRDYHDNFIQSEYGGEYDNLLFFFVFMYKKIRTLYDGGDQLKAYKQRKATHKHDKATSETL